MKHLRTDLQNRNRSLAWAIAMPLVCLFFLFVADLHRSENIRVREESKPKPTKVFEFERGSSEVVYLWRLDDLYERLPQGLKEKKNPRGHVSLEHELEWNQTTPWGVATFLQASSDLFFQKQVVEAHSMGSRWKTAFVALGENYWRLSADKRKWTKPQHFRVLPQFLPDAPIGQSPPVMTTALKSLEMPFLIHNQSAYIGYVAYISRDPDFPEKDVIAKWISADSPLVAFQEPGVHYMKLRGVSRNLELSEFSENLRFEWHRDLSKPTREVHPQRMDPALH